MLALTVALLPRDVAVDFVGIEQAAVEKSVGSQCQAGAGRAYRRRRVQRAFDLCIRDGKRDAERLQCRAVQVWPVCFARDRHVARRVRHLIPTHHLGVEPEGVALPGEGRGLGEWDEEMLDGKGSLCVHVQLP